VLLIPDRPGADSAVPGAVQADRVGGPVEADRADGAERVGGTGQPQAAGGGTGASEPVV